jgi:hypothetical protein
MKQNDVNMYYGLDTTPKKWDWITDLVDTIITKVNLNQIKTQVRKSNRSKRRLFQQGYYMKGTPCFGYYLDDRKLRLDPVQSEWVKKIFDWYDSGKSNYWIRQQLFLNEIEPPTTQRGYWNGSTITNLLQNKNYIGIDTYGDLVGKCPRIVSDKVFTSVNKKLMLNKHTSTLKHNWLLRGLIKCVDENPMRVQMKTKTQKYELYQCKQKINGYRKRKVNPCEVCPRFRNVKTDLVDNVVWEVLMKTLGDSSTIKQKVKEEILGRNVGQTKRQITMKINRIQGHLDEIENRKLQLESEYFSGQIPSENYTKILEKVIEQKVKFEDELSTELFRQESIKGTSDWLDWIQVHTDRISKLKSTEDFDTKRDVIEKYIREVKIQNYEPESKSHTLKIDFKIPMYQDKIEYSKNKNGTIRRLKNGTKKYKVVEGKTETTSLEIYPKLLDTRPVVSNRLEKMSTEKSTRNYSTDTISFRTDSDGISENVNHEIYPKLLDSINVDSNRFSRPTLVLSILVKSNRLVPTNYHYINLTDKKKMYQRIRELQNQGLGYSRIHKILKKEKFKVGKSRNTIDSMIKKMDKRDKYFNQKLIIEPEYKFKIMSSI